MALASARLTPEPNDYYKKRDVRQWDYRASIDLVPQASEAASRFFPMPTEVLMFPR
jgi:hypothetical protein